ncbi:VirR/VirH family protein [Cryptosporidium ryanae]|uniref:VirR/VirH family protein n=1 Tax=Cryptosporidium ryanae TaxID=515981 RepID=UPI00351A6006|nr:VirR/VirH family protein [Cryptosporidium ryanae]
MYNLDLGYPEKKFLDDSAGIVKQKRKMYGDFSCNVLVKLRAWIINSLNNEKRAYSDTIDVNIESLSRKFTDIIEEIIEDKKFCEKENCFIFFFKRKLKDIDHLIKFKIDIGSKGFINFFVFKERTTNEFIVNDFIIKDKGIEFFPVKTIGYCYSCWTDKLQAPRQGELVPSSRGVIKLLPEYNKDFILGLNEFSHLWVIYIKNKEFETKKEKPVSYSFNLNIEFTGVVSNLTSVINRIGISNVKIESIINNKIIISGLNLLNETPIIDIKPYHVCDIVDEESLFYSDLFVKDRFNDFKVEIPDNVLEKLLQIVYVSKDVIQEQGELKKLERKLSKLDYGGNWPFMFFKTHIEFIETIQLYLTHVIGCEEIRNNKYEGIEILKLDTFEIQYYLNNLTHIYLRFRNNAKRRIDRFGIFSSENISDRVNSVSDIQNSKQDNITGIEIGYLPPIWVDKYVEALEELYRAKEILSHLQKTQKKKLICVLEDKTMKISESEIDSLTNAVYNSFKQIEILLKDISEENIVDNNFVNSKYNKILRRNAESSIVTQLNPLVNEFKIMKKDNILKSNANPINILPSNSEVKTEFQNSQLNEQILISKDDDTEEITRITRNISELHSIFKEMLSIVIEQGSLVDRIDNNVDNSLYTIQNAHRQIMKMENSSRRHEQLGNTYTFKKKVQISEVEFNNMNADSVQFEYVDSKRKTHLFLPELIDLMGPLLNGTLFPYNSSSEKADADLIFSSIKEESRKLIKCFSNTPEYHVQNFLLNFQQKEPQIYLENKQFVLNFRNRDDPHTWFHSEDSSRGGLIKHIPISDLIKEVNCNEQHWLGDILDSESKRIQYRVNKCRVRYGAILNFLVTNSSAIPILIKNVRQRKIKSLRFKQNYFDNSFLNIKLS